MDATEIVNPVDFADLPGWLRVLRRGLLADPYSEPERRAAQWRGMWEPDRSWGARDRGAWVATLRTEQRALSVPGPGATTRSVDFDALTCVAVAATHRRRGLLSRMLTDSLRAAKERGDALSGLVAAEWPIYGRFGYAPATVSASYRYHPRRPLAAPPPRPAGSVRHVEAGELADAAAAVFDRARRARPGQVDRPGSWWPQRLGLDGYEYIDTTPPSWLVHDGPDGIDGLLAWRRTRGFEIGGALGAIAVEELVAASDDAYRDFWAYLAGIDLVGEIELTDRPVDEPIRWLLGDGRALEQTRAYDFLWLRLLDVPRALAARAYAVPGRLVLDVTDDDLGGYGAGRFALTSDADGSAECTPTADQPELRISQRALASIYLGGHRLRSRLIAGDVEELRPGAVAQADTMFGTPLVPWNATMF
ncbi:MAG TPA: GNAT family N-acetyltransferase [Jatrophihabitans sp.]|nr:GNAT family N-acetyltransferase [Jatrophihabitans sp.]